MINIAQNPSFYLSNCPESLDTDTLTTLEHVNLIFVIFLLLFVLTPAKDPRFRKHATNVYHGPPHSVFLRKQKTLHDKHNLETSFNTSSAVKPAQLCEIITLLYRTMDYNFRHLYSGL